MNTTLFSKTYPSPPFCEKEILRYAGCKDANDDIASLLDACIREVKDRLIYKVCYRELSVTTDGEICDFDMFKLRSQKLASNLKGCKRVLLFAATVGVEIDRLIAKYGRLSPAKALMFQAIGAERIEALCDTFCLDLEKEKDMALRPRFSPGYGDLPLSAQKDIFAVLDCERRIGLTLNDSFLMSPSKSVTAFAGVGSNEKRMKNKCSACAMRDCIFRGAL